METCLIYVFLSVDGVVIVGVGADVSFDDLIFCKTFFQLRFLL